MELGSEVGYLQWRRANGFPKASLFERAGYFFLEAAISLWYFLVTDLIVVRALAWDMSSMVRF